jgi:hypothetical protein
MEQANLDLKVGNVAQGFILRHIKEKSEGNQGEKSPLTQPLPPGERRFSIEMSVVQ